MPFEITSSDEADVASGNSQMHGTKFEAFVLGTKGLTPLKNQDLFDCHFGAFEEGCGLSIKATCAPHIELADATRVWAWPGLLEDLQQAGKEAPTVLFVVGRWVQSGRRKVIQEVLEIRLNVADPVVRKKLYGDITTDDIQRLHHGLREEFRRTPEEAREFAYGKVRQLNQKAGLIRLHPKIQTTKNQRRLQCSILLSDLINLSTELDWHRYTNIYRGLTLPLVLDGEARKFRKSPLASVPALEVESGVVDDPLTVDLVEA